MESYAEYSSLPRFKFTNSTMDRIDEAEEFEEEIDLEFTDAESESFCSETESDKAFIVSDEIASHEDATYEPSETGLSSNSESSSASTTQVRLLARLKNANSSCLEFPDPRATTRRRTTVQVYRIPRVFVGGGKTSGYTT